MAEKCIEALTAAMEELKNEGYDKQANDVQSIIDEVNQEYGSEDMGAIDKEEKDMEKTGKYEKGKHSGIMISISPVKGK